ncbi:hypothetical protein [Streptomyces nigra]|uniref:hypothetical protein n=1 Tax=Streptomyces nigra TaxID=1827580 RepID=UPI000D528B22|nr:hypothetical protein [Streptomyces nigra]AWE52031.1 hypothetical protein DC008_21645 [Streptomyces nigra]
MIVYELTLPGHPPGWSACRHLSCEAEFRIHVRRFGSAALDAALEQGPEAVRAYIERSGADGVPHVPACPFRFLPPDLLALGTEEEILRYREKILALVKEDLL